MHPKRYADARGLRLALARSEADFARRLGILIEDTVSRIPVSDQPSRQEQRKSDHSAASG